MLATSSLSLPTDMHVFERGWLSANTIVFTNANDAQMVDSGYCTHAEQTLLLVERVLGTQPLDTLINTHLHSDHCGGNSALQTRYPAMKTLIPPGLATQVRNWDAVALTHLPTGQICPQFSFDTTLQPGALIQLGANLWEIHAAAGHDPHSVIFFEPIEKILISADALWETGFGVVFPELEGKTAFSEVSATLDLIESLRPRVVIPGHGRVFIYNPSVMNLSRQRLDVFVKNPVKHARYAAKVIIKFKLLEVQKAHFQSFLHWGEQISYLIEIHEKFFFSSTIRQWISSLCEELIETNAAKREGEKILNI